MNKISIKIMFMSVVAWMSFGLAGVGVILLMTLLSYVAIGRDSSASHGISSVESSRLGGLAICVVFISYVVGLVLFSPYTPGVVREERNLYLWGAIFLCAVLGLAEDIKPDFLTPRLRLISKLVVFGALLWVCPEFIPSEVGVWGLDFILGIPLLGWILVTVVCVGFINAFNMADGANGLVPGIAVAALSVFFMEYGRVAEGVLLFACSIFLIFNVISGWFFLGDMGSYGLGAAVAGYALYGVAVGDFSIWFMAALLSYPCIDFLTSIGRRLWQGHSPFAADNGHLHNRLHERLKRVIKSRVLANSMTGLIISGSSSGVTVVGYLNEWWPVTSDNWLIVFVAQYLVYCAVMLWLARSASVRALAEAS